MTLRCEQIGDATLYLGDCRSVLPTIPRVGGIVFDPPYGMAYESGYATDDLWGEGRRAIEGDEDTALRDWICDLAKNSFDNAPVLAFGTWKRPRPTETKIVLVWDKGGALGMGLSLPWKCDHEEIYVLGKGFIGRRDSGSVIRYPPVQSMAKNGRAHPNEKPVELMMRLCAKVPGLILDPCMGSGSTGVAAIKLGRKFIGCEVVPEYFEIACERIAAAWAQPRLFADDSAGIAKAGDA